jgi:hypothetical protein
MAYSSDDSENSTLKILPPVQLRVEFGTTGNYQSKYELTFPK